MIPHFYIEKSMRSKIFLWSFMFLKFISKNTISTLIILYKEEVIIKYVSKYI